MRFLKSILAVLSARWFWTLVGLLLLSALVWFHGDLLRVGEAQPLAGDTRKLLVILGLTVLWGLSNLWGQARARRANTALVDALVVPAKAPPSPGEEQVAELSRRFAAALERLRKARVGGGKSGGRRWLYELPWYVMIGPPGAGKTTALAQSGLRFPLGEAQELRGAGGTRHCDWFFTDEAVLIDTAGRWTSQDSDKATDQAAWDGFLDLLRTHRPRQPLNGVLVAIAANDLADPALAAAHAAKVRARLEELETRLGVRLPAYLMVTKADQVAGFTTYFADLSDREREQVWGHTLPWRQGVAEAPANPGAITQALAELVARLDQGLPRRLLEEDDLERRQLTFGFSAAVARLGDGLARFVDLAFKPTLYERGAWLRGIYLTSGTQAGTALDRLQAEVAAGFGVRLPPPPPLHGDRSYFLTGLLRDVVFAEASLVGSDPVRERRERRLRLAAGTGMAASVLLAAGLWSWSFAQNRARQDEVAANLAAWGEAVRPVARERLGPRDADYGPAVLALDGLAAIRETLAPGEGWSSRFGLSQRAGLADRVDAAYRRALETLLLPRLALVLERDIRGRLQDPDYVLEALKVYLMLGGLAPVDPALVGDWFAADAASRAPDLADPMAAHAGALAALLPTLDRKPALDGRLQADAQATLNKIPLAKRAYEALVSGPEVRALRGWSLVDHAGPNATAVLVRRSGRPLAEPLPAILTHAGFHEVFLPVLEEAARGAYAEAWVLGNRADPEPTPDEVARLRQDMLRLYYDDAIAAWDGLVRDVTIVPINGSLDRAVEVTKALSGPNSPLKLFAQAVVRETALTVPPAPPEAEGKGIDPAKAAKAAGSVGSRLAKLAKLAKGAQGGGPAPAAEVPGAPVEAHFQYLRDAVEGKNGAPPPLEEAAMALAPIHAKLAEASLSANPAAALAALGGKGGAALKQAAAMLPPPLDKSLDGVAGATDSLGRSKASETLNAAWRADILPFCRTALADRFPFAPASQVDANMEDVSRLLAPGGMVDGFVKGPLAPFVDTSRQPWRDLQGVGLSSAALARLSQARQIGGTLFAGGKPGASFTLTPVSLDPGSASVTLDLDGQALRYDHGPARPTPFAWPGPGGTNIVRVAFTPVGGGAPVATAKEGTWSLFRLLHGAEFTRTGQPDLFEVTFRQGPHSARFRLRAASVQNPFDLAALQGFACPEGF